ncbi:urea transport protein [Colletotrichum asianum]
MSQARDDQVLQPQTAAHLRRAAPDALVLRLATGTAVPAPVRAQVEEHRLQLRHDAPVHLQHARAGLHEEPHPEVDLGLGVAPQAEAEPGVFGDAVEHQVAGQLAHLRFCCRCWRVVELVLLFCGVILTKD